MLARDVRKQVLHVHKEHHSQLGCVRNSNVFQAASVDQLSDLRWASVANQLTQLLRDALLHRLRARLALHRVQHQRHAVQCFLPVDRVFWSKQPPWKRPHSWIVWLLQPPVCTHYFVQLKEAAPLQLFIKVVSKFDVDWVEFVEYQVDTFQGSAEHRLVLVCAQQLHILIDHLFL